MFGLLMGTLQKFKQESNVSTERVRKLKPEGKWLKAPVLLWFLNCIIILDESKTNYLPEFFSFLAKTPDRN